MTTRRLVMLHSGPGMRGNAANDSHPIGSGSRRGRKRLTPGTIKKRKNLAHRQRALAARAAKRAGKAVPAQVLKAKKASGRYAVYKPKYR